MLNKSFLPLHQHEEVSVALVALKNSKLRVLTLLWLIPKMHRQLVPDLFLHLKVVLIETFAPRSLVKKLCFSVYPERGHFLYILRVCM